MLRISKEVSAYKLAKAKSLSDMPNVIARRALEELDEKTENYLGLCLRRIWQLPKFREIAARFLSLEILDTEKSSGWALNKEFFRICLTRHTRIKCHPKWLRRIFLKKMVGQNG